MGEPANLVLVDPDTEWTVHGPDLASVADNTPYETMTLPATGHRDSAARPDHRTRRRGAGPTESRSTRWTGYCWIVGFLAFWVAARLPDVDGLAWPGPTPARRDRRTAGGTRGTWGSGSSSRAPACTSAARIAPSWQDRIAVGDLGFRATLRTQPRTRTGVLLERDGASPIWIPEESIRAIRTERGLAGKVMTKDGVLVIRWQLPTGTEIDTGFRGDDKSIYPQWTREQTRDENEK